MFNYYYDFLYVPIYTTNRIGSGSTSSITLNGRDSSLYSYEFIVDDRNIGGTLHLDLESQIMVKNILVVNENSQLSLFKPFVPLNVNISVLGCLSKYRPVIYDKCEHDYKILIDKNSISVRSVPYPEMGLWYLALQYSCNRLVKKLIY
jgi:hypothetical protein